MSRPDTNSIEPSAALGVIADAKHRALVTRYLEGRLSGEMTLMYWLKSEPDVDAIRSQVRAAAAVAAMDPGGVAGSASDASLDCLSQLIDRNDEGCRRIASMLRSGVDSDEPARSVEEGIAFVRNLFDWSVGQSSESSVALYSLGNARILDAATAEIVALFQRWGIVGADRDLLEIGCGTGRFPQALAGFARSITGIDVSEKMIVAARERCASSSNVKFMKCSGRDLAAFDNRSFDLVFAIDSFPYLVQSGMALVERHFAEAQRVLRPGGNFVILEFSYRGDADADRADVARLAAKYGFCVVVAGLSAFSVWDGLAFHLR